MQISRLYPLIVVALIAGVAIRCGGSSPSSPSPTPSPIPPGPDAGTPGPPAILVGAGDIGQCGSAAVAATALLIDRISGIVFTTGDNAYPNGSAANFRDCFEPHWGRHRERTRPTPGNHDYDTGGAAAYYNYFQDNAGPFGLGYYSYFAGSWRVIALNSEIPVGPGSAQLQWLRSELTSSRPRCTMVYWHKPLFSSGPNGPNRDMREIWRLMYEFDADLVVNGHDHLYAALCAAGSRWTRRPDARDSADHCWNRRRRALHANHVSGEYRGHRRRLWRPQAHAERRRLPVAVHAGPWSLVLGCG